MRIPLQIATFLLLCAASLAQSNAANPPATAPVAQPVRDPLPPLRGPAPFIGPLPGRGFGTVQNLGKAHVRDFIDVSVSNGRLTIKWIGTIDGTAGFTDDAFSGSWVVRSLRTGTSSSIHALSWNSPDPKPNELTSLSLNILPLDRFAMTVNYSGGNERKIGTLSQQPTMLRLLVMNFGVAAGPARRNILSAANLFELRDKYPADTKKFIVDPLTKIFGHNPITPGVVEAYRRLSTISPDSTVSAKVQTILERFESRSSDDRTAAMKDLTSLGDPGVLAVVRLDAASLTPEQSGRVSEYLTAHDHGATYPGRPDKALLIDLLEMDNPTIRTAAAKELDVSPDASADDLRDKLLAAPATQPASPAN